MCGIGEKKKKCDECENQRKAKTHVYATQAERVEDSGRETQNLVSIKGKV